MRAREEQNIDFLETKLRQFMEILERQTSEPEPVEELEPQDTEPPYDEDRIPTQGEGTSDELREIELRISRLAQEIQKLEAGL